MIAEIDKSLSPKPLVAAQVQYVVEMLIIVLLLSSKPELMFNFPSMCLLPLCCACARFHDCSQFQCPMTEIRTFKVKSNDDMSRAMTDGICNHLSTTMAESNG